MNEYFKNPVAGAMTGMGLGFLVGTEIKYLGLSWDGFSVETSIGVGGVLGIFIGLLFGKTDTE